MSNRISQFQDFQLRNADQQLGDELLARGARMRLASTRNPDTGAVSAPIDFFGGMAITRFGLQNRAGSADLIVGIGMRWRNEFWRAGQWDDSEGAAAFILDDVDAKDRDTNDFALQTATNNDGFVIAAYEPFNWVSIDVTTAGADAGATSDAVVQYSNRAGTGWTALATNQSFTDEFTYTNVDAGYPLGELVFVWNPPTDWGKVTVADATMGGVPLGMYALQIRSTDAPAETAALARAIEVGSLLAVENVDDSGTFGMETCFLRDPMGDAIVAYFSTANAGNSVYAEWVHAG